MSIPASKVLASLAPDHQREIEREAAKFLAEENARQLARHPRQATTRDCSPTSPKPAIARNTAK